MPNSYKITGVIVNFNSYKFKEIVLQSIKSFLRLENIRLIIVDNSSTDGSYEFLLKKISNTARVELIKLSRNRGYAGAINFVFDLCYNEFDSCFFIANNDVILTNRKPLLNAIKLIEKKDDIASVAGVMIYPSLRVQTAGFLLNDLGYLINIFGNAPVHSCIFKQDYYPVTFGSGALLLINTSVIPKMPEKVPFPTRGFMYLDDIVFGLIAWKLDYRNIVSSKLMAIHYESLSSTSPKKAFLLGRAVAIQRNIIEPCLKIGQTKIFQSLYHCLVALKFRSNLEKVSFIKGVLSGLNEYHLNREYWRKYEVNITDVYHLHGIKYIIERASKFLIE
ncbi:MAG: glycosyltransferase [Ignisphaera sp.]